MDFCDAYGINGLFSSVAVETKIAETPELKVKVFAFRNIVVIESDSRFANGRIELYDIAGREVANKIIRSTKEEIYINNRGIIIARLLDKDFFNI